MSGPAGPGIADAFRILLVQRTRGYFAGLGALPQGGTGIRVKASAGFAWFAISYAALLATSAAPAFVPVYVVHGAAHLFLLVNIGHDANHGALSRKRWVNRLFSWTMDLCGVSSRLWRIDHHRQHHGVVNVGREDDALAGRGLLRLSPHQPHVRAARVQHLLWLPIYCAGTLDYLLVRDFAHQAREPGPAPVRSWALLIAAKLFYLGYMIVVPWLVTGQPLWLILLAFVGVHMLIGSGALLLFQTTHLLCGARFPASVGEAGGPTLHILSTTADIAVGSRWLALSAGGLHCHIIHHFLPGVCHTHYPALARIVAETASEQGLPYRSYPTFGAALRDHVRHLRAMARLAP